MAQSFFGIDALKSPTVHKVVPTSDDDDLTDNFRILRCVVAGDAVIVDALDNAITYSFEVGEELVLTPKRVNETGTTATLVGMY